jgi:hypothetical protein
MRRLMNTDPAAIGGCPETSDLQRMTDDGGPATPARQFVPEWRDDTEVIEYPLGPDPAWVNIECCDNLGETDTFDGPPGGQAMPASIEPRPSRPPTTPWPPRSSEGPRRDSRRGDRVSHLRSLLQLLAFVLVWATATLSWGRWAEGGWWALAGWFGLGVLSSALVGWILDRSGVGTTGDAKARSTTRRSHQPSHST